jgi:hypothetical protein
MKWLKRLGKSLMFGGWVLILVLIIVIVIATGRC